MYPSTQSVATTPTSNASPASSSPWRRISATNTGISRMRRSESAFGTVATRSVRETLISTGRGLELSLSPPESGGDAGQLSSGAFPDPGLNQLGGARSGGPSQLTHHLDGGAV